MRAYGLQVALLSLLSWAVLAPGLIRQGRNVVTDTYDQAAERFWSGQNPYQNPEGKGDWFKYSPFFAEAYGLFLLLPQVAHVLFWALLNCVFFWAGVLCWFDLRRFHAGMWAALVLCSMELDISSRYQQVNALVAGLTLLGMAAFAKERWKNAAVWLGIATNIKLLPGLFAAALLYPKNRRYRAALFGFSLVLLAAPVLRWGFSQTLSAYEGWLALLLRDLGSPGLVDLATAMGKLGWPFLGSTLRWGVLIVSLLWMGWARMRYRSLFPWGLFYTIGTGCLLLFSPRTESPTFVLFAPSYLFLAEQASELPSRSRPRFWVRLALGGFLITLCFTDLWPKTIWDPRGLHYASKALGVFFLWCLTLWLSFRRNLLV